MEWVGASALAVLLVGWLALSGLTFTGARGRGQRLPGALLAGLCFPVTWLVWYVLDEPHVL